MEIIPVNPLQKQLFDMVEKFEFILKVLESDTQVATDIEQNIKQHELDKLLDAAKRDLRNARTFLSREQEVIDTLFYQHFAAIFGE